MPGLGERRTGSQPNFSQSHAGGQGLRQDHHLSPQFHFLDFICVFHPEILSNHSAGRSSLSLSWFCAPQLQNHKENPMQRGKTRDVVVSSVNRSASSWLWDCSAHRLKHYWQLIGSSFLQVTGFYPVSIQAQTTQCLCPGGSFPKLCLRILPLAPRGT